jgi:hypothetical protein
MVLFLAANRRRSWKPLVAGFAAVALFSISTIGFNPYVTNLLEKQNPFFPAYQPVSDRDVLANQATSKFLARNRIEKFLIANFAVSEKSGETFAPNFVIPLTKWRLEPAVDARFSGFGDAFSAILLLAVLQIFLPGQRSFKFFALMIMLTVFSTPAAWWARLAPQTWLAVGLVAAGGLVTTTNLVSKRLASVMFLLLILNSGWLFLGVIHRQVRWSRTYFRHLDVTQRTDSAVKTVDNRYGLFSFYNRRKIIDAFGERVRILDECQADKRNRIFGICRGTSRRLKKSGCESSGRIRDVSK